MQLCLKNTPGLNYFSHSKSIEGLTHCLGNKKEFESEFNILLIKQRRLVAVCNPLSILVTV